MLNAGRPRLLSFESLENRLLLYAVSGNRWFVNDLSASFVPDGTIAGGGNLSSLFSTLSGTGPTADWQREFARALQTWANVTPLNFHLVSDDGSPWTTEGQVHGDPRFGDIRLLAQPLNGGALATTLYPLGFGPTDGDISLAAGSPYSIGGGNDLYSILLHESGHSLGLAHSADGAAVMYPNLTGVYSGLTSDDLAGIQSIYGPRPKDAFDAAAANDSFATASLMPLTGGTSASVLADLTSLADLDHFRITATSGYDTLQVSADARGKSLLAPKISIYDAALNLVGQADAGSAYGTVATTTVSGLVAGETYYLVADGATSDAFGMGAYRLNVTLSQSQNAAPTVQKVIVGSSQWTTEFRDQLAQLGVGDAVGYSVPAGSEQWTDLNWVNIDQISVQFSRDVDIQAVDLVLGATGMPPEAFSGFHYDPQSLLATWTLARSLDQNEWTIDLDGHTASAVRSISGVLLDGEWTDQISEFPSGNGIAGGDFEFRFTVVPGDVNHDQTVNIFDINMVSSSWDKANPGGDPNGDGTVNIFDINAISSNWSQPQALSAGGAAAATGGTSVRSPPSQAIASSPADGQATSAGRRIGLRQGDEGCDGSRNVAERPTEPAKIFAFAGGADTSLAWQASGLPRRGKLGSQRLAPMTGESRLRDTSIAGQSRIQVTPTDRVDAVWSMDGAVDRQHRTHFDNVWTLRAIDAVLAEASTDTLVDASLELRADWLPTASVRVLGSQDQ